MDDVLKKKIEAQIDGILTADPTAEVDAAFASAGHVDLVHWRRLFFERRAALAAATADKAKKPAVQK